LGDRIPNVKPFRKSVARFPKFGRRSREQFEPEAFDLPSARASDAIAGRGRAWE
jgi:hypothetical protein